MTTHNKISTLSLGVVEDVGGAFLIQLLVVAHGGALQVDLAGGVEETAAGRRRHRPTAG